MTSMGQTQANASVRRLAVVGWTRVSRTVRALGHEPRIIPAIYVKPFVKGQKNDYNDTEAIAEAALRPNLRFVAAAPKGGFRLSRVQSASRRPSIPFISSLLKIRYRSASTSCADCSPCSKAEAVPYQ
jgi:hypothetical protein